MEKNYNDMTEGEALYSLGVRAGEKDGVKGIMLDRKNKKAIFIPASDEKPDKIIAGDQKQYVTKGTIEVKCSRCGQITYVSLSTQKVLKLYPDTPVICIACFMAEVEKEKG